MDLDGRFPFVRVKPNKYILLKEKANSPPPPFFLFEFEMEDEH